MISAIWHQNVAVKEWRIRSLEVEPLSLCVRRSLSQTALIYPLQWPGVNPPSNAGNSADYGWYSDVRPVFRCNGQDDASRHGYNCDTCNSHNAHRGS